MSAALVRKRRKQREAISSFDALIDSPHDLASGPLVMPAGARLALSHDAGLVAGEVTVTVVTGRVAWTHPLLGADVAHKGSWAEEDTRVSLSDVPVGTATLFMVNPIDGGKLVPIATLVVA